ncbi:MAG: hypothetical protein LJE60_12315 [Thiocapsa sp.]|nr:hypothetical protein [Thiocapsa sp.]MCG6897874.1 hypothetical protein [Thiocapsa sp.]
MRLVNRPAADCGDSIGRRLTRRDDPSRTWCAEEAARLAGGDFRPTGSCVRRLPGVLLALALVSGCQSLGGRPADLVLETGAAGGRVLAIDADSRLAAVGTLDGSVRIWGLEDGAQQAAWRAHGGTVNGILFLTGDRLMTAGYDGRMAIWSVAGRRIAGWSVDSPATALGAALTAGIVATGHADGKVRLWDVEGHRRAQWAPHSGAVRAVALTPDGQRIASSGADGQVRIWSAGGQPRPLPPPTTDARTLAFSLAGGALLGGGWFDLYRWELPAGTFRRLPTEHRGIINSMLVLPDGRLATISRQTDSSVLILDPTSGATVQRIGRHDLCGTAVAVSPDGRVLVSTSDDATVRIWRLGHPSPPTPLGPRLLKTVQ